MSILGPASRSGISADSTGLRRPWGLPLTLAWCAVDAVGLALTLTPDAPLWVWIGCYAGVVAWAARSFVPDRMPRVQLALEAAMIVLGGVVAIPGLVLGAIPLAVAVLLVIGRLERPVWMGIAAVALAAASVASGLALAPRTDANVPALILGCVSTVTVAALVGISRRLGRISARRAEQLVAAERNAERMDDHARVARELHDVLAHGLGGLVVQLDAVDALLESGRTAEAAERVRAARGLARDGLVDARRAVDALRPEGDDPPVAAADFRRSLEELVDVHRSLGGRIDARIAPGGDAVAGPVAASLRRVLQESLSNARKHAPGRPVAVRLERDGSAMRLTVENPVGIPGALAATGAGRGLAGMRERFARIDGSVEAGESDGVFRVRAEVAA